MRILSYRHIVFVVATLATLPAAADWLWERLDKPSPPSMFGHSMAYDSLRDRLVLVGGVRAYYESSGYEIDPFVYEWDGKDWSRIPGSARPGEAATGAMVFDSRRNVCVFVSAGQTLEWNGRTWKEVLTSRRPPSDRSGHSMAYDSARGVTVLFGGKSGYDVLGDTWEYDGANWRQVSGLGPTPRFGSAMTFDSALGVTLLHGGVKSVYGNALSDLWKWDGSTWMQVNTRGGPRVAGHTMTYDPLRQSAVVFGGVSNYDLFDDATWEFRDGQWLRIKALSSPLGRHDHAAAFDARVGQVMVFGGRTRSRRYSDLWSFDGRSWDSDDPAPSVFVGAGFVYDRARHNFLLFGGQRHSFYSGDDVGVSSETWTYDGNSGWLKRIPIVVPPGRVSPAIVYDKNRDEVLIFGGYTKDDTGYIFPLRDMWSWNGKNWREVNQGHLVPPYDGPIFFDERLGKTVMVSAHSGNPWTLAVWVWDGKRWQETSATVPEGAQQIVYDTTSDHALLRLYQNNETWAWEGRVWKFLYRDSAGVRSASCYVFDESASVALCYGGYGDQVGTLSSAVQWNGIAWKDVVDPPPGNRGGGHIGYDPARDQSILFGGRSYGGDGIDHEFYDDTWAVRWIP